jgi:hypothetical protein
MNFKEKCGLTMNPRLHRGEKPCLSARRLFNHQLDGRFRSSGSSAAEGQAPETVRDAEWASAWK